MAVREVPRANFQLRDRILVPTELRTTTSCVQMSRQAKLDGRDEARRHAPNSGFRLTKTSLTLHTRLHTSSSHPISAADEEGACLGLA